MRDRAALVDEEPARVAGKRHEIGCREMVAHEVKRRFGVVLALDQLNCGIRPGLDDLERLGVADVPDSASPCA